MTVIEEARRSTRRLAAGGPPCAFYGCTRPGTHMLHGRLDVADDDVDVALDVCGRHKALLGQGVTHLHLDRVRL